MSADDTRIDDLLKAAGLYDGLVDSFGADWDGQQAADAMEGLIGHGLLLVEASPLDEESQILDIAIGLLQGDTDLGGLSDLLG